MKLNLKKHIVISLIFSALFVSCYNVNKPDKPKNLLSEDQMVAVLVDMAIVSSAKGINKKKLEDNGIVPDEYIYKKNNIDSIIFAESNTYYAFNIETYNDIYARVKDSLTVLNDKYKAIGEVERKKQAKKDSLKRSEINRLKEENIKNKESRSPNPAIKQRVSKRK